MKSKIKPYKIKLFAPVFQGWGKDRAISDYRDSDFVETWCLYSDRDEAVAYTNQDGNRNGFPHNTTGEVVLVEISIKEVK